MTWSLFPNTKAILLLTAPLNVGKHRETSERLRLREYRKLEEHLRERRFQPADLLLGDPEEVLGDYPSGGDELERIKHLLGRGGRLAQAVDHWHTRAIWVISSYDEEYPDRFRTRLPRSAPPLLYGCGDRSLLNESGLAVVGPREAEEEALDFARRMGALAARAGLPVVSGGARGTDREAMTGALEAGGRTVGVLAAKLEKEIMTRDRRDWIADDQMLMVSPYDPKAGFSRRTAMGRNSLIYNLADAALVVEAHPEQGGTKAGAESQLQRNKKNPDQQVPVYVRDLPSPGLTALREKGAQPWPNPKTPEELKTLLSLLPPTSNTAPPQSAEPTETEECNQQLLLIGT